LWRNVAFVPEAEFVSCRTIGIAMVAAQSRNLRSIFNALYSMDEVRLLASPIGANGALVGGFHIRC
jgi:hypothetical protein